MYVYIIIILFFFILVIKPIKNFRVANFRFGVIISWDISSNLPSHIMISEFKLNVYNEVTGKLINSLTITNRVRAFFLTNSSFGRRQSQVQKYIFKLIPKYTRGDYGPAKSVRIKM